MFIVHCLVFSIECNGCTHTHHPTTTWNIHAQKSTHSARLQIQSMNGSFSSSDRCVCASSPFFSFAVLFPFSFFISLLSFAVLSVGARTTECWRNNNRNKKIAQNTMCVEPEMWKLPCALRTGRLECPRLLSVAPICAVFNSILYHARKTRPAVTCSGRILIYIPHKLAYLLIKYSNFDVEKVSWAHTSMLFLFWWDFSTFMRRKKKCVHRETVHSMQAASPSLHIEAKRYKHFLLFQNTRSK